MCVISKRAGIHLCIFELWRCWVCYWKSAEACKPSPLDTVVTQLDREGLWGSLKHKPLFLHWRALSQNLSQLSLSLSLGDDCFLKDWLASTGPRLSNTFLTGHCKYSDLIHSICQKTRSANKQITHCFFFFLYVITEWAAAIFIQNQIRMVRNTVGGFIFCCFLF